MAEGGLGPGDRIRTCGLLLPKQALFQTELRPDDAGLSRLPAVFPAVREFVLPIPPPCYRYSNPEV